MTMPRTYLAFSTCREVDGRHPTEKRVEVVAVSRAAAMTTAAELLAIPAEKLRVVEMPDW
ncbi:MAG: hypothetical protein CMN50_00055 [SAR116 cluster bacterium]|nr:hypothetical protein [SAR116 cluster bacterium]